MELCSSFGKQRGECSKPNFQILVYYYYKLFTLVFNGFNFKPWLKQAMSF